MPRARLLAGTALLAAAGIAIWAWSAGGPEVGGHGPGGGLLEPGGDGHGLGRGPGDGSGGGDARPEAGAPVLPEAVVGRGDGAGLGGGDGAGSAVGAGPSAAGVAGAADGPGAGAPPGSGERRPPHAQAVAVAGAISGRVVQGGDGLAAAGAAIRCFRDPPAGKPSEWTTATDPDGRFRLDGLPPATTYVVEARAGEWSPEAVAGIAVRPAEATVLRDLVLQPGARLSGRVLTADGQPRATGKVRVNGLMHAPRESPVDAEGRWRVAGLAPGNYFVEAKDAGEPPLPVLFVSLQPGESRVLDLQPAPGVRLVVNVLRDGAPVVNAEVRILSRAGTLGTEGPPAASGGAGGGLDMAQLRTEVRRTDASGRAEFPDCVPGPYDCIVSHRDRDAAGREVGPGRVLVAPTIVAPRVAVQPVTLVYPSGSLTGLVVDAATQKPLGGVRVSVETAALRRTQSLVEWFAHLFETHAGTDGEGRFTLAHLPTGEYTVALVKEGYAATVLGPVFVGASGQLEVRAALSPGGGAIAGRVVLGESRAVQGLFVLIRDPEGADVGFAGVRLDGGFEVRGLRAGPHTLLVYAPNRPVHVVGDVLVRAGETTAVEVALD